MADDTPVPTEAELHFQDVLAEYLRACEGGQAPDREEWIARHGPLAEPLRAFFQSCDALDRLAPALAGPLPTPPAAGESGRRFGDFELLEEIARGVTSVIYKARQTSLGRVVALKLVRATSLAS